MDKVFAIDRNDGVFETRVVVVLDLGTVLGGNSIDTAPKSTTNTNTYKQSTQNKNSSPVVFIGKAELLDLDDLALSWTVTFMDYSGPSASHSYHVYTGEKPFS